MFGRRSPGLAAGRFLVWEPLIRLYWQGGAAKSSAQETLGVGELTVAGTAVWDLIYGRRDWLPVRANSNYIHFACYSK